MWQGKTYIGCREGEFHCQGHAIVSPGSTLSPKGVERSRQKKTRNPQQCEDPKELSQDQQPLANWKLACLESKERLETGKRGKKQPGTYF